MVWVAAFVRRLRAGLHNVWDVITPTAFCSPDPVFGCVGQHTVAFYKDLLGWIPAPQKYLAESFHQTINLERLALPQTNDYLMARISIESSSHFYTLETRPLMATMPICPGRL